MNGKLIYLVVMVLFLAGCDEPEKISGAEFRSKIRTGKPATAIHAEYLCEEGEKVYLRESSMSLMDDKILVKRYYYTHKSELDEDFYQSLTPKAECPPMFDQEKVTKAI